MLAPSMTAPTWSNRRRKRGTNGSCRTSGRLVLRSAASSKSAPGRPARNKRASPSAPPESPLPSRSRNGWWGPLQRAREQWRPSARQRQTHRSRFPAARGRRFGQAKCRRKRRARAIPSCQTGWPHSTNACPCWPQRQMSGLQIPDGSTGLRMHCAVRGCRRNQPCHGSHRATAQDRRNCRSCRRGQSHRRGRSHDHD